MGGLLHLVDVEQDRMAKKVVADKRHGGLEAPRNSLEQLPIKTYQSYCAVEDNVPYMYQVTQNWSEKNCYEPEAPVKKFISEEISKRPNNRHSSPSIVARLMGVDMLPLDTKPGAQHTEKKNEKPVSNFPKEKQAKNGSIDHAPFSSKSSRQIKFESFHHNEDTNSKKPRSREHPQEEELQKFKKEFEAFQAARLKECSKAVELGTVPSQWVAQKNLNKEKIALYANSGRKSISEKPKELEGQTLKASLHKGGGLQNHAYKNELFRAEERETKRTPFAIPDKKLAISSAPTKIVILRPGPDNMGMGNNEESQASSSGASEERGNMEEFLEEVKERLKCELQGKSIKRGTIVRGGGIETPYSERPSDPKQIAQRIAKQIRESVTMDLGTNLLRSESTRSYRSEILNNGMGSPEFISRDTRRFLSERLRNVLKRETQQDIQMHGQESSRSSVLDKGRSRLNKVSYWDSGNDEQEIESQSFRCGPDNDIMLHKELSPGNLVRSMSAPVSGMAFGKLLLEDRHVLSGAHIRRKHETVERVTVKVKKQKKERFNLREKVSSFKYSFTLRGRLFGRKIQSAEESLCKERDFLRNITSGPTVMMNFNSRYENSTEVPPSPASVCSSVHEEYWRQLDNLSPTMSSDIPPLEGNVSPQFFRDISSNLNELRRQLNQLEIDGSEDTMIQKQPSETELPELEDQLESYIRDLLVASGLYDGSSDKSLSRWDPFAKPISNRVFEEVEASYKDHIDKKVDHKALLDLLNEALSAVLDPPVTMSKFKKKAIGAVRQQPRGRTLLDLVWEIIRIHLYPPADKSYYSLDGMVGQDLLSSSWSGLMNDDVDALGKEIECRIIGDLIEEMLKDMRSRSR